MGYMRKKPKTENIYTYFSVIFFFNYYIVNDIYVCVAYVIITDNYRTLCIRKNSIEIARSVIKSFASVYQSIHIPGILKQPSFTTN